MQIAGQQLATFTVADAARIARDLYGLDGQFRRLPGEFDANFVIDDGAGPRAVLKISHPSERRALLDLQASALRHLAERTPELTLPRIIPTLSGEPFTETIGPDGSPHFVRLASYVRGRPLAETRPHGPELLQSLGSLLGTVDRALLDFSHPAAERELRWDPRRSAWIREYLDYVQDPARRALVERHLMRFETAVAPALPGLRHSVIHGDANDYNVVVTGGRVGDASADARVTGLIDYGDLMHTVTIGELAIGCAYAILDKPDPLAAAARVVAGYHAVLPLAEPDLALLYPLLLTRLAVSVTNAAYRRATEPPNEYLAVSEAPAWATLERLEAVSPCLAEAMLRAACGLEPSPTGARVAQWLATHADTVGPMLDLPYRADDAEVLDLSVGSPSLGDFAAGRAGGRVAVGRLGEARLPNLLFNDDEPAVLTDDGPETATVQLGVDLFVAAETPVRAPLDGAVEAVYAADAAAATLAVRHVADIDDVTFLTVYRNLIPASFADWHPGAMVERGTTLGAVAEGGVLPPHVRVQIVADPSVFEAWAGGAADHPPVPNAVRPSERVAWTAICPDPSVLIGIPRDRYPREPLGRDAISDIRRARLGPNLSIAYRRPLAIVRGAGQYLYDEDGRAYLDAYNNVAHVGHSHPRVVRAVAAQMAVLNTNTRYLHEALVRYAERLCATLPPSLSVCYFVNSASEANELALRMARAHTGSRGVIVSEGAYHGNTAALIDVSPYKFDGPGGEAAPSHVQVVPVPDLYRGRYRHGDPAAGQKYAAHVEEAVAQLRERKQGVAAFLIESLPSCAGQIVLPDAYLREAFNLVRAAGGVCIVDEVQVGFGRVGSHFWGFETQGAVPDIVVMGKPMGNGHPLAAVVSTPEVASSFANGMEYFNTFGGNPVSMAAGLAVLDVLEEEELQVHAQRAGARLLERFHELMSRHAIIGDARGLGLMLGLELVLDRRTLEPAPAQAAYVANRLRQLGILTGTDGIFHNVLKFKPPMVFTEADAERLAAALDDVLSEDFVRVGWSPL